MTIEKELADNTAAVKALTEVMREFIAAVGCSSLSALPSADVRATQASCQPSVYGPASPAEEAAAVAHADGLTASVAIIDEPQAPAPAPAPAHTQLFARRNFDANDPGTNCAETAEGGSTPAADDEDGGNDVVMRIPLTPRDGSYAVTEADVQFWTQAYPRVDVLATLRRIASWMDANPTKRKTRRGIRRCIDSWLARDQDNGKTIRVNNHSSSIGGLTFQ